MSHQPPRGHVRRQYRGCARGGHRHAHGQAHGSPASQAPAPATQPQHTSPNHDPEHHSTPFRYTPPTGPRNHHSHHRNGRFRADSQNAQHLDTRSIRIEPPGHSPTNAGEHACAMETLIPCIGTGTGTGDSPTNPPRYPIGRFYRYTHKLPPATHHPASVSTDRSSDAGTSNTSADGLTRAVSSSPGSIVSESPDHTPLSNSQQQSWRASTKRVFKRSLQEQEYGVIVVGNIEGADDRLRTLAGHLTLLIGDGRTPLELMMVLRAREVIDLIFTYCHYSKYPALITQEEEGRGKKGGDPTETFSQANNAEGTQEPSSPAMPCSPAFLEHPPYPTQLFAGSKGISKSTFLNHATSRDSSGFQSFNRYISGFLPYYSPPSSPGSPIYPHPNSIQNKVMLTTSPLAIRDLLSSASRDPMIQRVYEVTFAGAAELLDWLESNEVEYVVRIFRWLGIPTGQPWETASTPSHIALGKERINTLISVIRYLLGLRRNDQIPEAMKRDYRDFQAHVQSLRDFRIAEARTWLKRQKAEDTAGQNVGGNARGGRDNWGGHAWVVGSREWGVQELTNMMRAHFQLAIDMGWVPSAAQMNSKADNSRVEEIATQKADNSRVDQKADNSRVDQKADNSRVEEFDSQVMYKIDALTALIQKMCDQKETEPGRPLNVAEYVDAYSANKGSSPFRT